MGRPKKKQSERKSCEIRVLLAPHEYDDFLKGAETSGLGKSGYGREILIRRKPMFTRPITREAIIEINRIGNNVNQIARRLNRSNQFDKQDIQRMTNAFKKIYDLINSTEHDSQH